MMEINFTPQRADVQYKIEDEVIYIKMQDKITKVDFSDLDDGRLEPLIDYVSNAEKVDGELTITLIQPLDKDGNELPAIVDFEIEEYEEISFEWKSWEEIEQEENKPSELEQLKRKNEMLAMAIMELSTIVLNGGK